MNSGPLESSPSFPERVGRYELLLPIGTGGMATVYLGRVHVVGEVYREVALKLMHPFIHAEGREAATSLIEEAKLAVRIRHPNVIPVVEVGEGPQGVFLVMEYVEGDTLSAINRVMRNENRTVPLPIAARIITDALAGLHAAHELKDDLGQPFHLVHRDFSPQNILVGVDGISRLTDFGIAKAAGRMGTTSSGVIKGKVSYMAPEQALGKKVDRRCDIWAAGVVVWELLVGRRLYKQDDQVATLLKIVSEAPPRVTTVRPDVPQVLDDLVAEALCVDVDKRIPSAAEFRRRLNEAWKLCGGVAEAAEVGEFAAKVAATKLESRREQVTRVLRLRARIALVGENARASLAQDSTAHGGTPNDETTSAISASSMSQPSEVAGIHAAALIAPPRRSNRRWGIVAAVLGGGMVLGTVALVYALAGARAEPDASQTAALPSATQTKVEPAKPAAAPAPAKADPRKITLTSTERIESVSIDGIEQKIEVGQKRLNLELPSDTKGKKLSVVATTADGRTVTRSLDTDNSQLELDFPASRAVRGSSRPTKKEVRESTRSDQPGLAPTPYDK
jgi:eukaryotic-like serine/threonine-protein kinase